MMGNMSRFHIRPARPDETGLFYTPHPEEDRRRGTIGHVRMDFGRSGNEFWHTWWPRGPEELNSPVFKAELQEVVDTMRENVLKSRFSMERFCYEHGGKIAGGYVQNYGYIVETEHYRYIPILAHVERYRSLHGRIPVIQAFWHDGVVLQADTQSLFRGFGLLVQRQCRKLLSLGLIDLFSSDAHNCTSRPPEMLTCFNYISKKYGADYAATLCCNNAIRLLHGEAVRKDFS